MSWEIKQVSKPKLKNPILIEGLPGVGNVGKITVDFIIDKLRAKKLFEFSSYNLPHCVFINEDNLMELPTIEIYYKNLKNKTLLFLAGDIQPLDEVSCYEFCNKILDTFEKDKVREIITLGGIALQRIPKSPKVYCTGNSKKIINKYKTNGISNKIYGMIGPIIGVSGLLAGLAGKREIPAISLLAETYAHPTYLGIKGAREILKILNKELDLNINLEELDEEITKIEEEIKTKTNRIRKIQKVKKIPKISHDINYIG